MAWASWVGGASFVIVVTGPPPTQLTQVILLQIFFPFFQSFCPISLMTIDSAI